MEEDDPCDLAMALDHSAEAISLAASDLEHSGPGKAIEPNSEDQARQVELEDDYEVYQEAVFAGVAGFHRIAADTVNYGQQTVSTGCFLKGIGKRNSLTLLVKNGLKYVTKRLSFCKRLLMKTRASTLSLLGSQMNRKEIVLHNGSDNGSGKWTCQKCGHRQRCLHIKRAQDALQRLIHVNPDAKDERMDAEAVQDLPGIVFLNKRVDILPAAGPP
ncbi:hypothetical protein C8J56DRAFT_900165 [Mycena floridula]|nr:hypothetical protein C8J56DRAFT_900165 [Mycena floridula]